MNSQKSIKQQRFDVECVQRHIKTLEESLYKSQDKLRKMKDELYNSCEHDYEDLEVVWQMDELKCKKIICKECGKVDWKTSNGGGS